MPAYLRDEKGTIVCKFGGTSMATTESFTMVQEIMDSNHLRRGMVVSAPGKRYPDDDKVTDLLIGIAKEPYRELRGKKIREVVFRYEELMRPFGKLRAMEFKIDTMSEELQEKGIPGRGGNVSNKIDLDTNKGREDFDYIVSRGEWLCGALVADVTDRTFLDPVDTIFCRNGVIDYQYSYDAIRNIVGRGSIIVQQYYLTILVIIYSENFVTVE